jgi:hypothetical protein
MRLAEMHMRLDQLERAIDAEIDQEKTDHAQRLHRLRNIKNRAASMRVALAMGRDVLTAKEGEAA